MHAEINQELSSVLREIKVHESNIEMALRSLANVQRAVSASVPGAVFPKGELPDKESFRTYALALIVEIAELVQTIEHKAWKPSHDHPKANLKVGEYTADEFADVLAFLGVLLMYLEAMGLNSEVLAGAYVEKTFTNINRLHFGIWDK
jgi:dimeric dUTPase (all-alpha-NTP-PPase superfamily)